MNVKVYSTPACSWCVKAKDYLKSNNISFHEFDVSKDRDAAMDMVRKSGQRGVPVIEIDDNIIVGFDKQTINKLLGL